MSAPASRRRADRRRPALPAALDRDRAALANVESLAPSFDRSRYPIAYLRQGYLEAAVQRLVVARLRQLGCRAFVVDSGAARLRGRAARAGLFLGGQATGMDRGIPDVHATAPNGRAVYVEVKAPAWLVISPKTGALIQRRAAGEPTPEQVRFVNEHRRHGAAAGFAWGPHDVDAILAAPPEHVDAYPVRRPGNTGCAWGDAHDTSTAPLAAGRDTSAGGP